MSLFDKKAIRLLQRRYPPSVVRKIKVALPYAVMGTATLIVTFSSFDLPPWPVWALFAVLFVILEMFTVEVNDRLFISSSIMVIMTAGVIFATQPGTDATFAMALMAAAGSLTPADFKERRLFQPISNFGQLAVCGAVAGLVLALGLGGVDDMSTDNLLWVALFAALASVAYVTTNNLLVRQAVKTVYGSRNLQPWSQMNVLIGGQATMGLLGGLIGAAYLIGDQPPAVLVLMVAVYGIGHLSLYAFGQLRESHLSAIRGFVKTLEAKDMYTLSLIHI